MAWKDLLANGRRSRRCESATGQISEPLTQKEESAPRLSNDIQETTVSCDADDQSVYYALIRSDNVGKALAFSLLRLRTNHTRHYVSMPRLTLRLLLTFLMLCCILPIGGKHDQESKKTATISQRFV